MGAHNVKPPILLAGARVQKVLGLSVMRVASDGNG